MAVLAAISTVMTVVGPAASGASPRLRSIPVPVPGLVSTGPQIGPAVTQQGDRPTGPGTSGGSEAGGDLVIAGFDGVDLVARYRSGDGSPVQPLAPVDGRLGAVRAVAAGPDGLVYAAGDTGAVVRFDPRTGAPVDEPGGEPFIPGAGRHLSDPRGLAFTPAGTLLVTSAGTGRVLEYDIETGELRGAFVEEDLITPAGLVVTDDGVVLVADQNNDTVVAYGPDGSVRDVIDTGAGSGPVDLALVDGLAYVALRDAGAVARFPLASIVAAGDDPEPVAVAVEVLDGPAFTTPEAVALGPDGMLWVADYWTNEVRRIAPTDGTDLGVIVTGEAPFGPVDLVFLPDGGIDVGMGDVPGEQDDDPAGDPAGGEGVDAAGPAGTPPAARPGAVDGPVDDLGRDPGDAEDDTVMPDGFEINGGQFDESIDAVYRVGNRAVTLVDGRLLIDTPVPAGDSTAGSVISLGLASADPEVEPVARLAPVGPVRSYFLGDLEITGVASHRQLLYRDLTPGVDVRYLAHPNGVTYDLLLDAGVDPAGVALAVDGDEAVSVDRQGRLVISQQRGPVLRFSAPVSYQPDGRTQRPIESRYVLNDDGTVGFEVGGLDPRLPLVIDPTLDLSTYLGGSGVDYGDAVGVDSSDNVIVAGRTDSTDFPTTVGAYDTADDPGRDVVVSKLSADGTTLLWSTYVGGNGSDYPLELDVDGSDRVVVVGATNSTDFPTPGGYDTTHNNNNDGFVFRLSADGTALDFGTYLGGGLDDYLTAVDHTSTGDIVIGGYSTSTDFPVYPFSYDVSHNGSWDMVVVELTPSGNFNLGTYIGGTADDSGRGLVVGPDDRVHLSGNSDSTDFPVTGDAYDGTHNGGTDVVYVELASDFTAVDYGTYVGGSGRDEGWSLDVASSTDVVLAGETQSTGFPTTAGVVDTTHNGGSDVFVTRLDRTQSGAAALAWSTFFGGSGTDVADEVVLDPDGRPHLAVETGSSGLATGGAPDTTLGGAADAMVVALSADGTTREFATYHGGAAGDESTWGIVLDSQNRPVIVGDTQSSDLTTSTGAYDTALDGGWDLFVARFSALDPPGTLDDYYDTFATAALNGSDGTIDWTPQPWVEQGESDGIGSGLARIATDASCAGGTCIRIGGDEVSLTGRGWARPADLAGVTTATLTMDVTRSGSGAGLSIQVSPDGGANWTTLETTSTAGAKSHDITPYANAATWIRVVGSGTPDDAVFYLVDNVRIETTSISASVAVNSTGDADDVAPGDGVCDTGGTNADGDPACTLRAAITEANASAAVDTINFDIPVTDTGHSAGIWTITPATMLPTVTGTTTIDGTTQPGWSANTTAAPGTTFDWQLAVEIDGSATSSGSSGLRLTGDNSSVSGLSIHDFAWYNIWVDGASAVSITGNAIGESPAGVVESREAADGTIAWHGPDGTLGGTEPTDRNRIDGSTVRVAGTATTGLVVAGNVISTRNGLFVTTFVDGVFLDGPTDLVIGGTAAAAANTITSADGSGVRAHSNATIDDIAIIGNSMADNGSLAIDLAGDGVTANDAGDIDTGPNGLLNFPVITSIGEVGGTVSVDFDLDVPAGAYRIEFFENPSGADPGGYGEGEVFVHAESISHTGSGSESFSASFAGSGDVLTATATEDLGGGSFGSTSEFSEAATGRSDVVAALDDAGSAYQDVGTIVDVAGNDVDPNGDPITVVEVTDPASGSATTNGDGTVTYQSDPGYTGADSFDYWAIDAGTSLTRYWGLAGTGTDSIGGADGTLTGTTTVAGDFGQGLSFDEVDDRVTVPDITYGSDFTISFDFKLDDNTGTLFQYVYSHGTVSSANSINVYVNEVGSSAPNVIRTVALDGDDTADGSFMLDVDIASLVGDGQWHTYTLTGGSGGLTVYLDGFRATSDPARGTGGINPTGSVYLGSRQDTDADRYYGGSLDTVQLYDRALPPADVADLVDQANVATVSMTVTACPDSDSDGLLDCEEDANADADADPATNPGPDTNGDTIPNYLDADDDGDGTPTASENADPNGDGDPRDALDGDRDGEPDYLDPNVAGSSSTPVVDEQKISDTVGGLATVLDDGDRFGKSSASIGDIDGDGVTDVVVGAPTDDDGGSSRGAVYVLFLNADGTVKAEQKISDLAGGLATALDDGDEFGHGVAGIGDLDGDGIGDLAVGAYRDADGSTDAGAVYVLFLNADGTVKVEQKISDLVGGLSASLAGDWFGHSVGSLGDVDGDGVPDLVVGANSNDDGAGNAGAVFVLFLNADGTVKAEQKISSTAGGFGVTLDGGDAFGFSVAGLGDLDGDGVEDLVVGANGDDDGASAAGAAYVLLLNADGTVKGEQKISSTTGGLSGPLGSWDYFGDGVAGVGDIDGDGVPDLIVSAKRDDDGGTDRGAAYVLQLNADGTVKGEQKISSTSGGLTGPLDNTDLFGRSVASLGDLDGDGGIGLLVGTELDDDGGTDRGAVYVLDLAATSPANVVVVNSTGDGSDANPGDDVCDTGGTNSEGDPECTLRAAIEEANASVAVDTIRFGIPTSDTGHDTGLWTISPGSALPLISDGVDVDGTSQPGWVDDPVIRLDGSSAGATSDGLRLTNTAVGVTVRSLMITRFGADGVHSVPGANGLTVVGSWIGTDGSADPSMGNSDDGLDLRAADATIGGSTSVEGNRVLHSADDGIHVTQASATDTTIEGNIVTDNGDAGVNVVGSSRRVVVGGSAANAGNEIRGNGGPGVNIATGADDIAVLGNTIVANSQLGIDLDNDGVTANDVGDVDTGTNNLLNHPVLAGAPASGTTSLDLDLDAPAGDYRIEVFTNPTDGADPSDRGEGETLIHAETVTHTGSGSEPFTLAGLPALSGGAVLTATATEDLGGGSHGATSEFSAAVDVLADTDGDGLWDHEEDANRDADSDPVTNPGPDTDGDTNANYNDPDDDGDGIPTASENPDPNGDGDPRDALDTDRDGQPDYLDAPTLPSGGLVVDEQKISDLSGGLAAALADDDEFGRSVAALGDLDGDGIVDIAVGAPNDDVDGTDRGAVYVLLLNGDGTVKAEQEISNTAGGLEVSIGNNDAFGYAVAGLGDLDGDGVGDLLVGAEDDDDGGPARGAVYVLRLNSDGTVKAEQKISDLFGGLSGPLDDYDRFGYSVAGLGDVDGDGVNDAAVGAALDDDGGDARGAVYILFLNADGTVKAEQKISDTAGGLTAVLDNVDLFGSAVAGPGDVDGDGVIDLAVGAVFDDDGGGSRGAVHVLFLNTDGTVKAEQKISDTDGGLVAALEDSDRFGTAVGGAGDLDGNGAADLLVGAADDDGGTARGGVYILFLDTDGTVSNEQKISDTSGQLQADLDDLDYFGAAVAGLGDLDGDGTVGLAVGAWGDDDGGGERGAVHILDLNTNNNAPVLDNAGTMTLDPITEDDFDNAGNTVAEIVASAGGDRISDADGDPEGIIVESAATGGGWWEFSTDTGATWTRLAWYHYGAGFEQSDRLRYVPGGYSAETPTLTIRAWDHTFGVPGVPVRDYATGGTAAYSAATETISVTVTDVDDLPSFGAPAAPGVAGGDNVVAWDLEGRTEQFEAVAEAPDGSLYGIGHTDTAATPGDEDVLVVKFAPDGSLDQSFGIAGHVLLPLGAGQDRAHDVAVQADGKVLVAGSTVDATTDAFLLRLNTDGTLDTGYGGGDGIAIVDGGSSDSFTSVVVQSDGLAVAAGSQTGVDLMAARFDAAGLLDPTYGTAGVATVSGVPAVADADVQTDDKLVTAGTLGGGVGEMAAVRLNTDGTLDTTFGGGDGIGSDDLGITDGYNAGNAVAVSPDGTIVVTGESVRYASHASDSFGSANAVRFTSSGLLDSGFGDGAGYVRTEIISGGSDGMNAVDIAADGDIVVAGELDLGYKGQSDTVVARYLADGSLDTAFDGDGIVLTNTGRYWNHLQDVIVAADGDVVAAGDAQFGSLFDAIIIRYDATTGDEVAAPPVNDLDGAPSYLAYGAAVVMDRDVRVFDAELIDAANWDGAGLTITRQGGANANDGFEATGTLDPLTQGGSIVIGGVTVGIVTTNSAGTLQLDFNTGSNEALVGKVFESIGYANDTGETGTVTMEWTFTDGHGASDTGTVDITIALLDATVNATGDGSDAVAGDGVCDTGGTNADGDPECTLRSAIEELNAFGGGTIDFDIPATDPGQSGGVWTIAPGSDLPSLAAPIDLDATTQTGWSAWNPVVALDGTELAETRALLHLDTTAGSSRVAGLSVVGSDVEGVQVANGATGVVLEEMAVGVPPSGGSAPGNGNEGLLVAADGATVTNTVVSGSGSAAIRLTATATNATVTGNRIGTDLDGTGSFGAGSDGIVVSAAGAAIGSAGAGNTIVGATAAGIRLSGGSSGRVQANRIGMDLAATEHGVGTAGVVVTGGASFTIGGTAGGEGNTITGAAGDGVRLDPTAGTTAVIGNTIYGNGQAGIDLNADGVTTNDPADVDTGPNGLLNFPVLTAPGDGATTVELDLDVPAGDYRIEVFTNPTGGADPSGYGEAEQLVAARTVTHTGSGLEPFTITVPTVFTGDVLSTTVTESLGGGSYGATSEISATATVVAVSDPVLDASTRRSDVYGQNGLDPATAATTGVAGSAVTFDGADDLLRGPALDMSESALTVGAWVRPSGFTATDYVVSKQTSGGTPIYELGVNGTSGQAVAVLTVGGGPVVLQGGSVTIGAWHHLVVTWDGSTARLYVDGAEVAVGFASGLLTTDVSTDVIIGNRSSGTTAFDGDIDHVEIRHTALDGDDIAVRYGTVVNQASIVSVGQQQTDAPGDWTVSSTRTRSGGFSLAAPETSGSGASAWAVATGIDEPGTVFESWWWTSTATDVDLASGTRAGEPATDQFDAAFVGADTWNLRSRSGATLAVDGSGGQALATGSWVKVEQWTDQNGNSRLLVDGLEVAPWSAQTTPPDSGSLGLRVGRLPTGETWYVDDPRARRLVRPEPTSMLGALDRD